MKTTIKVTAAVVLLIGLQGMTKADFSGNICPKPGLQCNGCQKAVDCVYENNVIIAKFTNETCPGKQVCDASKDATCSPDAICRYKKFECPNTSEKTSFPDPYSCLEYHLCTNGHQFDFICNSNHFFNTSTTKCEELTHPENGCSNPIPPCMKAGDKGEVGDYEWECMEETSPLHTIYPKLTKKGDLTTTSSGTTPTTTTSSGSTTTSLTTTTSSGSTPTSPTTTTSSGSTTTSPTTTTSSGSTTTSITTTTSSGSTPTSPTTTTSSGSTTTSPATTTSSGSTTTSPPPTTPMPSPCTNGVGAYPFPGDCRKFYLCYLLPNGSMNYEEQRCRDGSHYDEGVRRCIAGSCSQYPSTLSTPTPGTTIAPVTCTAEGALPDKDCCNCYYLCYFYQGGLKFQHMCCRDGSHFVGTRCVAGSCSHPSTCVRT